jgi:hypothetical protein
VQSRTSGPTGTEAARAGEGRVGERGARVRKGERELSCAPLREVKPFPAGTRCRKLTSHLVPAGVPTANYSQVIFFRRSPAAAYSIGVKSLVEASGRARDGSEEERRSGRDGTATAATWPPVPHREADNGGRDAATRWSTLVLGRSLAEAKSNMEAGGHRQVADKMRQRVAAADEAAERTAFA